MHSYSPGVIWSLTVKIGSPAKPEKLITTDKLDGPVNIVKTHIDSVLVKSWELCVLFDPLKDNTHTLLSVFKTVTWATPFPENQSELGRMEEVKHHDLGQSGTLLLLVCTYRNGEVLPGEVQLNRSQDVSKVAGKALNPWKKKRLEKCVCVINLFKPPYPPTLKLNTTVSVSVLLDLTLCTHFVLCLCFRSILQCFPVSSRSPRLFRGFWDPVCLTFSCLCYCDC